jgi:hypothetical protein
VRDSGFASVIGSPSLVSVSGMVIGPVVTPSAIAASIPLVTPVPVMGPTSIPIGTGITAVPTPSSSVSPASRIKLMRSEISPRVYYITEKGYKRWIPTEQIFLSYGNRWEDIVTVPQYQLYAITDDILIKLPESPKIYKIENNKKRWISTWSAFERNGFSLDTVAPVNQTELDYYPLGITIR